MKLPISGVLAGLMLAGSGALTPGMADPVVNPPCTRPDAPANTVCPGSAGGDFLFSNTSITLTNITTTQATATVNLFQTEFVGSVQGGPVLYDQIFSVAFSDPSLSGTAAQIESFLAGLASGPLSFAGPVLASSSTSSSDSSNTVVNSQTQLSYTGTGVIFGPATLTDVSDISGSLTGYSNDVTCTGLDITTAATPTVPGVALPTGCTSTGPYLFVLAGEEDVNTYVSVVDDIDQTTTDTTTITTTQIYDIVGIPEDDGDTDVPEPVSLSIFGAGLAGVLAMRRRKLKAA